MSIQVLIVDDEKLERVLIRKGFDWEANGFEVIGEAGSAKEALEFISHRKPDVIITDVNMPYMDGLELSQQVLSQYPQCRIVIVTGYREFEYARKAVKLGVEDFLLKPISVREVAETACRLKESISAEKLKKQEVEKLRESVLADRNIVMESFFQRLVEGRVSEQEARGKLSFYGCEGLVNSCVCLNLRCSDGGDRKAMLNNQSKVFELIGKEALPSTVCFIHYLDNIVLFFIDTEPEVAINKAMELHKKITHTLKDGCAAGISRLQCGFDGISIAYEEAEKAMRACVFLSKEQCVTYEQYLEVISRNPDSKEINWEDLLFCVQNCLVERVQESLSEYIALIDAARVTDVEYLRLMTMQLLSRAATTLHKYGVDLADIFGIDSLYHDIRQIFTLPQMEQCLKKYVQAMVDYHESKRTKKSNKIVDEARKYLDKNLFDPRLSLNTTAAAIFTNESYLSRTFKKETGLSLMEYILKKRIEESIRLLNTTDLKVYEIAERVGFRDHHYFSICFKKHIGITVKEFKGEGKNSNLSGKNVKLIH